MAIERKAELRRRRARHLKMRKLRAKLRAATSNDEKNRIMAKMMRINPFIFSATKAVSSEKAELFNKVESEEEVAPMKQTKKSKKTEEELNADSSS